mmetsp:Transcript_105401/g.263787  ORF Transcript_105401/g.263787 Transcript_105401/m.263787 type:complete len:503 (-) Transcript_105401:17-1525(-)
MSAAPQMPMMQDGPQGASQSSAPLVRVLLTGGPGAGKSSALATLRDRISKRGFQVIVVPENATALLDNSGGYDPSWHGSQMHVRLQQMFLKFQIEQEDTYGGFRELRPGKPHLLLHDRGCLDGRLFCTDQQWKQVLDGVGRSEDELLKRYDLIIHMTTVAADMEEMYDYGPGSTNPSRYHTPEQARHADVLAQEIYARHPHVRVIPNFPDFNQKMEAVVRCVTEAVQVDGLAGDRERQLLPADSVPPLGTKAWPVEPEIYDIQVTFLDAELTESLRRRQLRGGNSAGSDCESTVGELATFAAEAPQVLYEFRHEVLLDGKKVNTRRVLTADAYKLLKTSSAGTSVVVCKQAVCFIWQGHYYEICSYTDAHGSALPDSCTLSGYQVLDRPLGAPIPPWIECCGSKVAQEAVIGSDDLARAPVTRQLSRNATVEAASSVEKTLTTPPPSSKRPRDESAAGCSTSERPLKRQSSVPEGSSLSKVVAGSLSPVVAGHERQPESCPQ